MAGGYLRTNWRSSENTLAPDVFGQAMKLGSWMGGAGADFQNGGLVLASVNISTDGTSYVQVEAISAMNIFYGSNGAGAPLVGGTSGYKIIPIGGYALGNRVTSASISPHLWATVTTSDDSIIRIYQAMSTISAVASANNSIHFVWFGFIVSGP